MGIFKIHWMLEAVANSVKQKNIYPHILVLIIQLATSVTSQAHKR